MFCQRILLLLILLPGFVSAQKSLKRADKEFISGELYEAVISYEAAFRDDEFKKKDNSIKFDAFYKYAEACKLTYHFNEAAEYYKKFIDNNLQSKYPDVEFYYAFSLKHLAKYDSAKLEFQKFTEKDFGTNKDMQKLQSIAKQEIISCELAVELLKSPIENLSVTKLGDNINTNYADFAPHLVGEVLYYSTMRFESQAERRRSEGDPTKTHLYSKLMLSGNRGKDQGVQNKELNLKYKNIGNSSVSLDGKRLYHAKGVKQKKKNWEITAKLYVSELDLKKNKWKKAVLLPFNSEEGTTTQPHVSYDSISGKEVIYFTSSRTGGQGGLDIWKVSYEGNGSYGTPKNLGNVINTQGDELTPHYHHQSKTLYFSSNWHPNLGGYDIFKSKDSSSTWTTPLNVGIPLNTAANDIYFYISPLQDSFGYVTSNRVGSKILIGKACCNDIYQLDLPMRIEPKKPEEIIVAVNPDTIPLVVVNPDTGIVVITEPNVVPEPVELPSMTALRNMLPISLYFHDDNPNPNSNAVSSGMSYTQSFNWFIQFKQFYASQYASQFSNIEQQQAAKQKSDKFFTEKVQGEYNRLNQALAFISDILEKGESIEIVINGYASPIGSTEYNMNLTKRRISTAVNEINLYNNGKLVKYINSGKLKITANPIGEAQSNGISDKFADPSNSIYSPEASEFRRITFDTVKKQ